MADKLIDLFFLQRRYALIAEISAHVGKTTIIRRKYTEFEPMASVVDDIMMDQVVSLPGLHRV